MRRLRVAENQRTLCWDDGAPYLYLADTAWELFYRLTLDEARAYLRMRARQGFTAVQAVALAELDRLNGPNAHGDCPLRDGDPARPNDPFFEHIDRVLEEANGLGITIGFLPTWGDKVNPKWSKGPVIFNPENAHAYGLYLGRRYRQANLIWVLGGDRPCDTPEHEAVWDAMAAGLREGDGGSHLMTYHTMGGATSAEPLHNRDWLAFNMIQSGHSPPISENWRMLERDYARLPTKPCMDGEPNYEDHWRNWRPADGYFDDADVRRAAYYAITAGVHGHTYWCNDVWQMACERYQPIAWPRMPWYSALHLPGAWQMGHLRRLLEGLDLQERVPDQGVLVEECTLGGSVRSCRAPDRTWALAYTPTGTTLAMHSGVLDSKSLEAIWFNPRAGRYTSIGTLGTDQQHEFVPPTSGRGEDWVLLAKSVR